ncbi:MAG TPA: hypothetical protein VHE30_00835 [Polyangiaceae bacterium]|nr:hypothetical protein [Polyangiaceae bacterium]
MLRSLSLRGPHLARLLAALAVPLGACSSNVPKDGTTADEAGFDKVVYVVRQTSTVNGNDIQIDVADGMGQVMDYGRYVPGARIEVRNLVTRETENILEGARYAKADVEGMDLSFDATKIVFSMKLDGNDSYHVYTANLSRGSDAKNPYGIRQLTAGTDDDMTPIWAAGSHIVFVTNQMYTDMGTRADEYNHARRVTQLATISEVGGDADRKVCSQNLSHTFNPFRMQSGQIGYSRWEHLENVNDSKLFAMNPDCTQMIALAGQHDKPANSLVQVAETADRNVFIAVATNRENTIQAGALVRIDARSSTDDTRHDEERAAFDVLTPGVPRGDDPSPIGRYRSPHVLPDGRLLVSWADGPVNDQSELSLTPPDFGVYIYDPATRKNKLVFDNEGTWELYAQPVAPHAEPPPLTSIQNSQDTTIPMVIGSVDVRQTSLFSLHGNTVSGAQFDGTHMDDALKQAVKVRIIEGFSSEAAKNVTMFGLTMAEGAAILGEAPVLADGSWRAKVPPFIPMHLQAVDEFDLAIRSQTTWIQGMPGEDRVCGGCHEERTTPNLPSAQQLPLAASQPQDFMKAITDRTEYPWFQAAASPTEVQKILDAKCVSCHNDTTNGSQPQEHYSVTMTDENTGVTTTYPLDRLNFSTREVTVHYDRRTASYPISYVSIFYPNALEMEKGAKVTGTLPPKWGIPSDARNSKLIEVLNVTSAFDQTKTAWALGQPYSDPNIHGTARAMHPEDVGVTLSREERVALIRAFDMGGQFYSRQNTGFVAYGNAPATP